VASFLRLNLLFVAAVLTTLTSCATRDAASNPPEPKNGIAEYGEIVAASQKALGAVLQSLEQVGAQTQSCPPKLCAAFARQVQGLEVESIRVRARSQAILARGDAYFEHWQENLLRLKDPRVRELAEQHRPELQQHFASIKGLAQNTREAFKPFLANLRSLQGGLDSDPARVQTDATKGLIQTTKEKGRQVEQLLASIAGELKAMTVILTPAKPSNQH
jgi:Skp family chaperone for outer membrane proteins